MSSSPHLPFPLRATFVALPLENEAKWQFQALQEELKPYENCFRFQNPQTPHLTLQYWNEVMEIEYEQIRRQCESVARESQPFSLAATGVETFGSRGQDRVLFLTIAFSEELARLKKACPWPSDKPFSPHITLARISHPERFSVQKKKIMKSLSACCFSIPVDRLRLYAMINNQRQIPLGDFVFAS